MNIFAVATLFASSLLGADAAGPPAKLISESVGQKAESAEIEVQDCDLCKHLCRKPFQSDHAFDNFVGPVSNPIFTKDARSLTEVRGLFIQNWIPRSHPVLPHGNYQVYAMQARVALTDRLTLIADKDGYALLHPDGSEDVDGWMNLAAGAKYTIVRDVERQLLVTAGAQYEVPSGEKKVFQGFGGGMLTVFATVAKEINVHNHAIFNIGQQIPLNSNSNSGFLYLQAHYDREFFGWLYPLVEFNWFHYNASGNHGIPGSVGEGDGHVNFGTSNVVGNDFATVAIGGKARFSRNIELGAVWERPISRRQDLMLDRITAELILRY